MIGNGWLHESPKNVVPRGWDARGKSALRKCMFMPSPYAGLPPEPGPSAKPLPAPVRRVEEIVPYRKADPSRQARVMPAYIPPVPLPQHLVRPLQPARASATAWYEDPIALGSLLILLPPIGLAALWSSKRYSTDARWALTIMTGLTMSLAAAVLVALVLRA